MYRIDIIYRFGLTVFLKLFYPLYLLLIINNKVYLEVFLLILISYLIYLLNIFFINYVVFFNRPDLRIKKWYYCFLYPLYSLYILINYIIGFLSVIFYYGPFFIESRQEPKLYESKTQYNTLFVYTN